MWNRNKKEKVKKNKKTSSRIFRHLLIYLPPIVATIALVLIGAGVILSSPNCSSWKEITTAFSVALIAGGVISYMFTVLKLFGFFKEQLIDVLFGNQFLSKRNDIGLLWDKISMALYEQKFKEISEDLHKTIKDKYFPTQYDYYTKHFDLDIYIKYIDKDKSLIEVIEITTQKICSYSKRTTEIKSNSSINYDSNNDIEKENIKIDHLKINNENLLKEPFNIKMSDKDTDIEKHTIKDVDLELHKNISHNAYGYSIKMNLSGKDDYTIERQVTKTYCITQNPIFTLSANNIYAKMTITVNKPSDLFVEFSPMGVPNSELFIDRSVNNIEEKIKKEYNGIILPGQGCALGLSKN